MEEHARIYKEKLAIEHENKVHGLESARNDLNRRISLLEEEIKKEKSVNQDKSGKVASLEAEMGSKIKEIVQLKQTMNQMQHQLNISSSGQLIQNPAEVEATKKGKSPIPNQNPAMHKTPQREIPYQKLFSDANKKDVPASATEQMEIPSGRKQENLFTAREKSLVESSQDLMPGLLGQIVRNNSPCGSGSKTPRKSAQVHNIRGSPGKFGEANPGNKNAGYDLGYQDRKDDQTPFQGAQVESINKRVSPSCAIDPHIPGLEPGSILRDEPQRYHIRSFEEFRKDTHSTPLTSPPSSDAGNEPSICADTPTPVTRSNRRKDLNIQDLGNDDHTELEENEEAAEDSIASKDLRECYRQRTLSTLSDFKRDNPEAWSSSGKAAKPTTPNPAAVSPISANQRKPMNKSQNGGRKRPAENEPEAISTPKRNRGSPHPRGTPQSTRGKPKDPRAQSQLSHWDSNVVASGVAASNNRRQPNRGRGGKMYGGKRKH
ncbi:hypothetical protein L228DRAFT_165084 [Xylona heveae TC161]|uniref:Uncharacterized protein n=1 Tax=Xylona heveae (strain CBS 132557 / TC161) TaxID=1328760 RepID=A0A165FIS0_XYLHT|nr:hypothetical protein L228DRAFT_165084 [Xylona heveae TC161]KZF21025.1 hypothetical protein L228DRAFT_165084 [Xylona heveae TC161]